MERNYFKKLQILKMEKKKYFEKLHNLVTDSNSST